MAAPKLKIVDPADPVVQNLPDSIVIGPYEYDVVEMTEIERLKSGNLGYCDEGHLTIGLGYDEVNPQHRVEVMIHEILHALMGAGSIDQDVRDAHEEQIVTVLAKGLFQVARDNPHVLKWINDQYKFGTS